MEHETLNQFNQEINSYQTRRKKSRVIITVVFVALGFFLGVFIFKASNVFTIAGGGDVGQYKNFKAHKDPDRLNVLVLGIGGAGHEGGLLADSMILMSFDKKQEKAAMVSIPRDLLVDMPDHSTPERINFAYALGEQRQRGGGGLKLSKEVVQYVTGVHIDHAVVVNFNGFERLVNTLGGVSIYRETPFVESLQWQGEGNPNSKYWRLVSSTNVDTEVLIDENPEEMEIIEEETPTEYWQFYVPAGLSILNGQETLYYVRSRYGSSDFDRARRQQQIINSIKTKALSLGVISNPLKVFDIMNILGDNVRTDMGLGDIRELVSLINNNREAPVIGAQLDTSEQGLLISKNPGGKFVLVPRIGDDNFEEIREFFKNIFE